jgi:biopolymer transport protein TolR
VALQRPSWTPDTEVQLRADQGVPYGRVVEVMGEAQKAGLNASASWPRRPRSARHRAPARRTGACPAR